MTCSRLATRGHDTGSSNRTGYHTTLTKGEISIEQHNLTNAESLQTCHSKQHNNTFSYMYSLHCPRLPRSPEHLQLHHSLRDIFAECYSQENFSHHPQ